MTDVSGIAAERLLTFIQRIERLSEEMDALRAVVKEVKAEAKGEGFCLKAIAQILKERKMDAADRQEQEAILDVYRRALGMLSDTPLGQAAMKSAGVTVSRGAMT